MNTRKLISSTLVFSSFVLAACGAEPEDVADDVSSVSRQGTVVLLSKLYDGPDAAPNPTCDEYTELKITKVGASFVADLTKKLSPTSTCEKLVVPDARAYKVTTSESCGSTIYKGKYGNETIEISDHRPRLCEDYRPYAVEATEVRGGSKTFFHGQVEEVAGAAVCKVGGKSYKAGESYTDADGCNTCTCRKDGTSICTEVFCGEEPVEKTGECRVGDKTYEAGESFPAPDGCNICNCQEGGYSTCTEKFCG